MAKFRTPDGMNLHYRDEGHGPPVLCLAGLTRNGDDFAHVLPHLSDHRVIRLDARGRGQSDRAADFTSYNVLQEAHDALALLDHLGLTSVAVLGTSRGGLIAMALAAGHRDRLAAVVLNDIGPVLGAAGLTRIMDYVGREPDLPDLDAGAHALARAHAQDFPGVPDSRWQAEAAARWQETPDGLRNRYDPALHKALLHQSATQTSPGLWPFFEALQGIPTGAIRGANSDILSAETLDEMARRHPGLVAATVPDRGHVPFLDEPEALSVIRAVIGQAEGDSTMNIDMIRAAQARLHGRIRHTPLLWSPALDEIAGRRILVKPECLQHTGSFKYRGGASALSALAPDVRARGVLAYSSGNHAQGIARAAREHGVPAVIVMPRDAPALKLANTRALGAEVVLYDRAGGESREEIGTALAAERRLTLIRPFDEPQVIAGQGTAGLEIAADAAALGIAEADVLVCCGGGGLTSGIALALEAEAPGIKARPVEPKGFDDVARSLAAHAIRTNAQVTGSICDAIVTPSPGEITFPIMDRLCRPGLSVTDDEALAAMALAFRHLKIVLEPGGAVALAAALWRPTALSGDAVIAVASGGNVDAELFVRALETLT